MEEWIGVRAYARHRGDALSAVQKAIKSERITAIKRDERGRVIAVEKFEADRQWAANTDAIEAARNGKTPVEPAAPSQVAPASEKAAAATEPAAGGDEQGSFLAARIKEAELRGELLELDKHERIGSLAPWALVESEFGEIFGQLKSSVFRIADRKAQILAAETDPVRVHRLLNDEFRMVFDECSRRFGGDPAGVAGDAAVAGEREAALP